MTLKNCKIVGDGVTVAQYQDRQHKRGSPLRRVTRSDLVDILACPFKWRWTEDGDDAPSSAMVWGTILDALILPIKREFKEQPFVVHPSVYPAETKKGGEELKPWNWNANYCKEWREANAGGRPVVSPETYAEAQLAAGRLRDDPVVMEFLRGAGFQVMIVGWWEDEATGLNVPVGGLLDIVPAKGRYLADLKTTGMSAGEDAWQRTVNSMGLHVQAALYIDLFNSAAGEQLGHRDIWRHIVQEQEPPYAVARHELTEEWIQLGRAVYEKALGVYCQCLKSDRWPGYNDGEEWNRCAPKPWMLMAGQGMSAGGDGLPDMKPMQNGR